MFCCTHETNNDMADAAQLEIELLRTRERVRALEEVVQQQSEALKESARLLAKIRPPRPTIPHDRKLMVAADQGWKCLDPYGDCPMWKFSDGTFSVAGGMFECDHKDPYSTSFSSTRLNLACLCIFCHQHKCRLERLGALEQEATEAKATEPDASTE